MREGDDAARRARQRQVAGQHESRPRIDGDLACRLAAGTALLAEQARDLVVRCRAEVLVPEPDRPQVRGHLHADDLVDVIAQGLGGSGCGDRHRQNHARRAAPLQGLRRSLRGATGGEPVIDQQDRSPLDGQRHAVCAVAGKPVGEELAARRSSSASSSALP